MKAMTGNPLLGDLLAAAPPILAPVRESEPSLGCAECGLTGGVREDYRFVKPAGLIRCRVCALGRTAAWEPARVRLALVPELAQGLLNSVVTRLTVDLMRARAGEPIPAGIDARVQAHLLDALQQRAKATRAALPYTASAATLRQTLLALPAAARAGVRVELAGLRYLPEPADPELARFFNRRRARAV